MAEVWSLLGRPLEGPGSRRGQSDTGLAVTIIYIVYMNMYIYECVYIYIERERVDSIWYMVYSI